MALTNAIEADLTKFEKILQETREYFSGSANDWYRLSLNIADILQEETIRHPKIIDFIPIILNVYRGSGCYDLSRVSRVREVFTHGYIPGKIKWTARIVPQIEQLGFTNLLSETKPIILGNILIPLALRFGISITEEMFPEQQVTVVTNSFTKNKKYYTNDIPDSFDFLHIYNDIIPLQYRTIINSLQRYNDDIERLKQSIKRRDRAISLSGCFSFEDLINVRGLYKNQVKKITLDAKENIAYKIQDPISREFVPQEISKTLNNLILSYVKNVPCWRSIDQLHTLQVVLSRAVCSEYVYIIDKHKIAIIYCALRALSDTFRVDEIKLTQTDDEKILILQQIIQLCSRCFVSQKSRDKIQEMVSRRTYKCLRYSTERLCYRLLSEKGISPILQYKFYDCRDVNPLPFDFAFYLGKKICCIETDGQQHEQPVKIFGGDSSFQKTRKHDKIKTDFCQRNHIPLLRLKQKNMSNWKNRIDRFLLYASSE